MLIFVVGGGGGGEKIQKKLIQFLVNFTKLKLKYDKKKFYLFICFKKNFVIEINLHFGCKLEPGKSL